MKAEVQVTQRDGHDTTISLPKEVLDALGYGPGQKLFCIVMDGVAQLTPDPNALAIPMMPTDPTKKFAQHYKPMAKVKKRAPDQAAWLPERGELLQ